MTDDELKALVARLRSVDWNRETLLDAADAIEALMAERNKDKGICCETLRMLEHVGMEREAAIARAERAEAELAELRKRHVSLLSSISHELHGETFKRLAQIEREAGRDF